MTNLLIILALHLAIRRTTTKSVIKKIDIGII